MIRYKRIVTHNEQTEGVICIRLAEVRKSKGLTQEQLSVISGVSRVSIARYETGRVSPNLRIVQKLADALKVPVSRIVDRKAG